MSLLDRFKQGFNRFKDFVTDLLPYLLESNILTAVLLGAVKFRTLPSDTTPWDRGDAVLDLVLPEIPDALFSRYGKPRFTKALDHIRLAMNELHTGKLEQRGQGGTSAGLTN